MVKKFLTLLVAIGITLFSPPPTSAHFEGQPPFFKVNDTFSPVYPVPLTSSVPNFELPQDIAPQPYLVNQPITFEIDRTVLPLAPEVVENAVFAWQFGDQTKATGFTNQHTYKQPGSYILTVDLIYQGQETRRIQAMLIHIIPTSDYQLPQPVLKVNGQVTSDPIINVLKFDFNQPVQFDASDSQASAGIKEYLWDFGDGNSSPLISTTHTYNPESNMVFPILRVTDTNGYYVDAFVQIYSLSQFASEDQPQPTQELVPRATASKAWFFIFPPFVILLVITSIILITRKKNP